jgi:hypothetical protein
VNVLRLVGTLLWVGLILQFGFMAVSSGEGIAWALFGGCLAVFVFFLWAMQRRDDRSAMRS